MPPPSPLMLVLTNCEVVSVVVIDISGSLALRTKSLCIHVTVGVGTPTKMHDKVRVPPRNTVSLVLLEELTSGASKR